MSCACLFWEPEEPALGPVPPACAENGRAGKQLELDAYYSSMAVRDDVVADKKQHLSRCQK